MTNRAQGKNSRDAEIGNDIVEFINRSSTPYPTEVGAPSFDLVDVKQQKDLMRNVARMHAQQEYDRIMEMVEVLKKQADSIQRRIAITDAVHAAEYDFTPAHGACYWLLYDEGKDCWRLAPIGPREWSAGAPEQYVYFARVKWLGDYTWIEVDEQGEPIDGGDKWNNNI
jgi:hypothetical protein